MDDRVAFEEKIGRALDDLYTGALLLTRDADRAESLVVETVAEAFRARRREPDSDSFRNRIVSRMVHRHLDRSDEDVSVRGADEAQRHDDRPALDALQALLHRLDTLEAEDPEGLARLIRVELQELPLLDRAAVWLVTVLGFTYAEAASALHVDSSHIRRCVFRGRYALQLRLGRALGGPTRGESSSGGRLGRSTNQGGR